jgi:hypothetical protein
MAKTDTSPPKEAPAEAADEPPSVGPLTRRGYKRTAATQRQINDSLSLAAADLIARARPRDEKHPGILYLTYPNGEITLGS